MIGSKLAVLAVLAVLAGPCAEAAAQTGVGRAVAIVVHPDVDIEGLAFSQLRQIFLGHQQFWDGRRKITLLMRAPDSAERDVILRDVYQMSEDQFRQYWIAKIFRSEVASGPKIVYSTEMARNLVSALPGSITFMLASDLPADAKVLRIDGKLPGEAGYPLQ